MSRRPARRTAVWIALSCAAHAALLLQPASLPVFLAHAEQPAHVLTARLVRASPPPATLPAGAEFSATQLRRAVRATRRASAAAPAAGETQGRPLFDDGEIANLVAVFKVRYQDNGETPEIGVLYVSSTEAPYRDYLLTVCGKGGSHEMRFRMEREFLGGLKLTQRAFMVTVMRDPATAALTANWRGLNGGEAYDQMAPLDSSGSQDIGTYLAGRPAQLIGRAPRLSALC